VRRLVLTRLDQQVATRRQPGRGRGGHEPLHIEPVRATVERHPRLVHAGLPGQQPDRVGGYVGCVGDEDFDAAPQRGRQRLVEVAFEHLRAGRGEV